MLVSQSRYYACFPVTIGSSGKKIIVVNAHDGDATIDLAINGVLNWHVYGGMVQQFVNIRELTNPLISSSVHGAGWLMIAKEYDNNWA